MRPLLRFVGSLLFLLGQVLSAAVFGVFAPLFLLLPSLSRARVIGGWARFNLFALRWLCGIRHRVSGLENLPRRPSVIIANHQSAWETLAFQNIFPPQSYILKRELLLLPFFGWGLAANRPIAIDRARKIDALRRLLRESRIRLREGRWLVVFPEGARMPPGRPGKFQVGGVTIAARTGAVIVPVAHNAGRLWPKGGFFKYPGVIDVVVGPPIESHARTPKELNRQVERWIGDHAALLPQSR